MEGDKKVRLPVGIIILIFVAIVAAGLLQLNTFSGQASQTTAQQASDGQPSSDISQPPAGGAEDPFGFVPESENLIVPDASKPTRGSGSGGGSSGGGGFGGGGGGGGGSSGGGGSGAASVVLSKIEPSLQEKISQNPNELVQVVVSADDKNLDRVAQTASENSGRVVGKYELGDAVVVEMPASKVAALTADASVGRIYADFEVALLLADAAPQISAPVAWESGATGKDVVIAVLDTGVNSSLPSFGGRVVLEKDFTGEKDVMDYNGHGTFVASIAAGGEAANPGGSGGQKGIAPDAFIINAKVLDSSGRGKISSVVEAINWVVDPDANPETNDGAKIILMSFGALPVGPEDPMTLAVKAAVEKGVIVVAAAGNCGPCSPCGATKYTGVLTPGISPDAITVGAVDKNNQVACFSSRGNKSNEKPDVVAPGVDVFSFTNAGERSASGTSVSAPFVAGAAAAVLEARPDFFPQKVRVFLKNNALDLGPEGADEAYGAGLVSLAALDANLPVVQWAETTPAYADIGQKVSFKIKTQASVEDSKVTLPNGETRPLSLSQEENTWSGQFTDTTLEGTYKAQTSINNDNKTITFTQRFEVANTTRLRETHITQIDITNDTVSQQNTYYRSDFIRYNSPGRFNYYSDYPPIYKDDSLWVWPRSDIANNPKCACWDLNSNWKVDFCVGKIELGFKNWAQECLNAFSSSDKESNAYVNTNWDWYSAWAVYTGTITNNKHVNVYSWNPGFMWIGGDWYYDDFYFDVKDSCQETSGCDSCKDKSLGASCDCYQECSTSNWWCWGNNAGAYTCQYSCATEGKYAYASSECCSGLLWDSSTKKCYKQAQCTSGACCDTSTGMFRSSSYVCNSQDSYQYGCPWGTNLGNDVGVQYKTRYCSGSSSDCSGSVSGWGSWQTYANCNFQQLCVPGDSYCHGVACTSDSQCGTNGYSGSNYCSNGDVYRDYTTYSCNSAGTPSAYCASSTSSIKQQSCGITTYGAWGANYCVGNDIKHSRTVHNKGCSGGACMNYDSTQTETIMNCGNGCQNGACIVNRPDLTIFPEDIEVK